LDFPIFFLPSFLGLGVICKQHDPRGFWPRLVFMVSRVQLDRRNGRSRVRQKVHAPAYASFSGASKGIMLDLHEVLDISENGVAIQCSSQLEPNRSVPLCLDLSGDTGQIHTTGLVAWSDSAGRAGLSLPNLPDSSLRRLREWLFFNAMVAAANAESSDAMAQTLPIESRRPSYSDMLTAVSAVQREAEALGSDLVAELQLVASRARTLLRASGAAIALATQDADTLICRASAGDSAPPVGAALHVGSGFSGECVRTGRILRCADTETDPRVDRESCRTLGIRSMLAAPLRKGEKVNGLIEVFSPQPATFDDDDSGVLQRLAETVIAAVNRAAHSESAPQASNTASSLAVDPVPFPSAPGSVLFASDAKASDGKEGKAGEPGPQNAHSAGIRLPRSLLFLLIASLAAIFLAMGWVFAPWIQQQVRARAKHPEQTVLTSSPSLKPASTTQASLSIETATLGQLQNLAAQGNAAAENALGLRYATGDGVKRDEKEAVRWFTNAAEHGNVAAQSKLGQLYWSGRGVSASLNQAYFWTVLARASGNDASQALAPSIAARMTPAQAKAIEKQAADWYSHHESPGKTPAGR
jgi:putative methionine-R-sulfoxide reductase with GAF domain